MCRRVTCGKCGRPTFAGCGAHVEQVLGDVPKADRCQCHLQKQKPANEAAGERKSLMQSLFGK